jgi:hypothetical protein
MKKKKIPESKVLAACQDILTYHPRVAFWWRQNTGAAKMGERFVRFSFPGASDLMAVLKNGKFLAVECKASGKKANEEQDEFLKKCNRATAYGICVDDPQQLIDFLA